MLRKHPFEQGRSDQLPGAKAASFARLAFVLGLAAFQYWLLVMSIEVYQDGHPGILWLTTLASLLCFVLAGSLMVTGEIGSSQINDEMEKENVIVDHFM